MTNLPVVEHNYGKEQLAKKISSKLGKAKYLTECKTSDQPLNI